MQLTRTRAVFFSLLLAAYALPGGYPVAQSRVTTPKEALGFNFGDDYQLANYKQIAAYWQTLDRESDRVIVQEIGKTAEGRPHLMAMLTSPDNHKRLARYKEISRRLALADGLTDDQARALAKEGKAVVWIDGGLHATETLGAQQLGEMVYQLASRDDEETRRFLDDCIVLLVHANPDGNDLVADWYMRHAKPQDRSLANVPRLYQKYIGHDNNRDFFASTQAETENINRVLYHEWFPQILYNHHQSGPAGTVLWSPPLRDPFNYRQDPLLVLGLQLVGTAMHTRLAVEGKPGATMRSGGPYDGWWNGGIRNTATFHNIIALLTEMIGSPTPMRIPLVMQRQIPTSDLAYPIAPQEWHFRQSIDYSISINRAVLDLASRLRENFLFNIYRMGKNSIERGTTDSWTASPTLMAAVAERMASETGSPGGGRGGGGADPVKEAAYWAELRKPERRDPRGYIIPSSQTDFPTATKFINALRETGIIVQRATREFTVGGKTYPTGSYVVPAAQAFRPHVLDMFEPQDHPNVFPYPGAPPTQPYDNAGWTLALQMGVEFDRVLEPFTGPFEPIADWNVKMPAGQVTGVRGATGFMAHRGVNNAAIAINRLLAAGEEVFWVRTFMAGGVAAPSSGGAAPSTGNAAPSPGSAGVPAGGRVERKFPAGAVYVRAKPTTAALLEKAAAELGVTFEGITGPPPSAAAAWRIRLPRVGLWDQYGGSMDAGWARWILEQFEFRFDRVFAPALDAGNLNAKFDVLVFVEGGIPSAAGGGGGRGGGPAAAPRDVPQEYQPHLGRVSVEKTLPALKSFIENGGTVIAIGDSASNLARYLALPIEDHLVENGKPLPRTKYFVPGSLLSMQVDVTHPAAHGMTPRTDAFFDNSPVFRLGPDAASRGVTKLAWFDSKTPLRSGWAWGQHYLDQGVAAVEAKVGKGRVLLYGPEILKRAQPHGTFKLLFNGIFLAGAAQP